MRSPFSSCAANSSEERFDLHQPVWFKLDVKWQADTKRLQQGIEPLPLPAGWRLLLVGDGHTTRNLQILTGQRIEAHVLESQGVEQPEMEQAPDNLKILGLPLQRRQVWLGAAGEDRPLIYAVSWWNRQRIQEYLPDPQQPIGRTLIQSRLESFRQLMGLYSGANLALEGLFQQSGPFWARHYLLWHGGQPLTLIYEVFSPTLSDYLGASFPDG